MKSKHWIMGFLAVAIIPLVVAATWVVKVDPYFHYHKPHVSTYYYDFGNQRSQNNGIVRNFDYDGIITGTSMTENFKTSEAEKLFGGTFVKVPFSGGSFKEVNDNLKVALAHNDDVKIVIRGLDMGKFIEDKDTMRNDLGRYPTYLYNDNLLDDVEYVFNRDVLFKRVYKMVTDNDAEDFRPGIPPFDSYSRWMPSFRFGINTVCKAGIVRTDTSIPQGDLSEEEKARVLGNVRQNITSLAEKNPEVTFYYFITPYGAAWWQQLINEGAFNKQIQAEQMVIEEILKVSNIKLYSFNNLTDVITDLNNYKDAHHYAEWVNSLMLKYMKDETCLLTESNYEEYLSKEKEFYWTFNYEKCFNDQEDYEQDYYAAALLNEKINDVHPCFIDLDDLAESEMMNAEIVENQHAGKSGVLCKGRLNRGVGEKISVSDYIKKNNEFNGFKISINDISEYKYLVAYGKKIEDQGQPSIYVYEESGIATRCALATYEKLDEKWHQYLIDVSGLSGKVEIVFQGGYVDATGSAESQFVFSDIALY